jgi:hypothetical protein
MISLQNRMIATLGVILSGLLAGEALATVLNPRIVNFALTRTELGRAFAWSVGGNALPEALRGSLRFS